MKRMGDKLTPHFWRELGAVVNRHLSPEQRRMFGNRNIEGSIVAHWKDYESEGIFV